MCEGPDSDSESGRGGPGPGATSPERSSPNAGASPADWGLDPNLEAPGVNRAGGGWGSPSDIQTALDRALKDAQDWAKETAAQIPGSRATPRGTVQTGGSFTSPTVGPPSRGEIDLEGQYDPNVSAAMGMPTQVPGYPGRGPQLQAIAERLGLQGIMGMASAPGLMGLLTGTGMKALGFSAPSISNRASDIAKGIDTAGPATGREATGRGSERTAGAESAGPEGGRGPAAQTTTPGGMPALPTIPDLATGVTAPRSLQDLWRMYLAMAQGDPVLRWMLRAGGSATSRVATAAPDRAAGGV
jgi:hypothetical protein